ncbi:hypothetical protein RvY_09725 [Ramazzottius varieornatus]|uniref:Uncharacterized protein n=1 Tax=Ramazzottius varieornatus TaxID=947166 RepID=A0A1D1VAD6_RAMVA|nr:hypothetical protein RvY_09725 [Ramazzottius varieornatus]
MTVACCFGFVLFMLSPCSVVRTRELFCLSEAQLQQFNYTHTNITVTLERKFVQNYFTAADTTLLLFSLKINISLNLKLNKSRGINFIHMKNENRQENFKNI